MELSHELTHWYSTICWELEHILWYASEYYDWLGCTNIGWRPRTYHTLWVWWRYMIVVPEQIVCTLSPLILAPLSSSRYACSFLQSPLSLHFPFLPFYKAHANDQTEIQKKYPRKKPATLPPLPLSIFPHTKTSIAFSIFFLTQLGKSHETIHR